MTMEKWLLVGLGNPETKYKKNRHNVGSNLINHIISNRNTEIIKNKYSEIYKETLDEKILYYAKPFFYINESGIPVIKLLDEFSIHNNNLLIIVDDMNLALGNIRIRQKGHDGGHNGLKSVEYHLATTEYARLRIGIGSPGGKNEHINYVLGDFSSAEEKTIDEVFNVSEKAIDEIISNGFSAAMGRFNQ